MLVHWEKTIAFIGPSVNKFEYAIDVALDPVEPLNPEIGLLTYVTMGRERCTGSCRAIES
jgi:hypothetical protein